MASIGVGIGGFGAGFFGGWMPDTTPTPENLLVYNYYASLSDFEAPRAYALSHHEERYFANRLGVLLDSVGDPASWVELATAFYSSFSGLPDTSTLQQHVDAYYAGLTGLPTAWVTALKNDAYALLNLGSVPATALYPSTTLYPAATLYPGV